MKELETIRVLKEAFQNTSISNTQTDDELEALLDNASKIDLPPLAASLQGKEILKRIKEESSIAIFKTPADSKRSSAETGLAMAARNGEGKLDAEILEKMRTNKSRKMNPEQE